MTTEQRACSPRLLFDRGTDFRSFVIALSLCVVLLCVSLPCAACSRRHGIAHLVVRPWTLAAPYSTARTWAVVPLLNESGTTVLDPLRVTDTMVQQVEQTHGLAAVPTNRTLAAMDALGLERISTPSDAVQLARSLGADAVLVGSITSWSPYDPPRFGLHLTLVPGVAPNAPSAGSSPTLDPFLLQLAPSDTASPPKPTPPGPPNKGLPTPSTPTVVSVFLDASSGDVELDLRHYAKGRNDPTSALGWRRYTASMTLFTQFACHRTLGRLLLIEQSRQSSTGPPAPD